MHAAAPTVTPTLWQPALRGCTDAPAGGACRATLLSPLAAGRIRQGCQDLCQQKLAVKPFLGLMQAIIRLNRPPGLEAALTRTLATYRGIAAEICRIGERTEPPAHTAVGESTGEPSQRRKPAAKSGPGAGLDGAATVAAVQTPLPACPAAQLPLGLHPDVLAQGLVAAACWERAAHAKQD